MKNFLVKLWKKLFFLTCALMIAYCIFYQYIANIPYIYIVKLILLLLFVVQFIGWIIDIVNDSKLYDNKQNLSTNTKIRYLYLKSDKIIAQIFSYYFAVYLIFMLDKKSILYNYLVLFLFGLYLGCRIAIKAYDYLRENQENK